MKIHKISSAEIKRHLLQFADSHAWLLCPVILTAVQLYMFTDLIDPDKSLSTLSRIAGALADSFIIFLIFLFIPCKISRYIIWLPGFIITLFCVAYSLYFKAFSDIPSWESIKLISTVDSLVLNSSTSILSLDEASFFLIYLIEIFLYLLSRRHGKFALSAPFKKVYLATTLIVLTVFVSLSVRRAGIYSHSTSLSESFEAYVEAWKLQTANIGYYKIFGFQGYLSRILFMALQRPIPLSDKETQYISQLFLSNAKVSTDLQFFHKRNYNKNLIFIIVESLASDVLTHEYSATCLPVLTRLANDSSVIAALNVVPQTGPGRSSDGQFIYNTGLLPLRSTALIESHSSADYPSLAKALNYKQIVEVIGESKKVWRHFLTSSSYGFDSLFDNVDESGINADKKIFEKTLSILDTLPQPFFLLASTLSMHDPYNSPAVDIKTLIPNQISDPRDRNYWTATAAFDLWLGRFLDTLKNKDLYDNSIIVIAADHEPKAQFLSSDFNTAYIPIFILNSGHGLKISDKVDQADLFPTILDIMGIEDYTCPVLGTSYRGLGRSLLPGSGNHNDSTDHIDKDDLWKASERLILSGKLAK